MNRIRRVQAAVLLVAAIVLIGVAGCSSSDESAASALAPLRMVGSEVEVFDDYQSLYRSADIVVIGRFTDFNPGRRFQSEFVPADVINFIDASIEVEKSLKGDAGRTITVEMLSASSDGSLAEDLGAMAAAKPQRSVFFIRDKTLDPIVELPDEGRYRLVNSYSMVTETDAGLITPLGQPGGLGAQLARPDLGWTDAMALAEDLADADAEPESEPRGA